MPFPASLPAVRGVNSRFAGRALCWGLALGQLAFCLALFAAGWNHWGDVLIDFGREVYISWRLAQGQALYRDVSYAYGPLAPYVQAALLALFGPTLPTVVWTNLAVLALTVAAAWKTVADSRPMAVLCGLFALTVACGLNDILPIGNYNFLTPYSHALTYGLLFSFLCLALTARLQRTPSRASAVALGVCYGLALLTKPEICIALTGAMAVALPALCLGRGGSRTGPAGLVGLFLAGLGATALLAFGLLCAAMPVAAVLDGFLMPLAAMFDPRINGLPFYRAVFGGADYLDSCRQVATSLVLNAAVAAYCACLGVLGRRLGARRPWLGPLAAVALTAGLVAALSPRDAVGFFLQLPRAWPPLLVLAAVWLLIRLARREGARPGDVAFAALAVFAALMPVKIFLNANLLHYGALLLSPGILVLTVLLLDRLPRRLGPETALRRSALAAGVVFVCLFCLEAGNLSLQAFSRKTAVVATARGTMHWDGRGVPVQAALDRLNALAKPGDTLAVFPEGAMLNFLTGRPNPTRYANLLMWEDLVAGPEAVFHAYAAAPPDWVLLIQRSTAEYGFARFGLGYGQELARWLSRTYERVALYGEPPLLSDGFGVELLRLRKDAPAP